MSMISIYLQESINSTDSHSIMDSVKINLNQGLNGVFWIVILWTIGFIIDYFLKTKKNSKKGIKIIYIILATLPIIFVVLKWFKFCKRLFHNIRYFL